MGKSGPPWIAIVHPATGATGDRVLVEHEPKPQGPVDWLAGVAPDVFEGKHRPTTYALWIGSDGALHSAVRTGKIGAPTTVSMTQVALDHIRSGAVARLPSAPSGPARAVTFQVVPGEVVAGPLFWRGPDGAPAVDEEVLLDAIAADLQRRHASIDPHAWVPALAGPLGLVVMNMAELQGVSQWWGLAAFSAFVALLYAGQAWRVRRRRRRLIRQAGAVEVVLSEDVPLLATPIGVQIDLSS